MPLIELREWYFRYPYLTRLRDATVLTTAVSAALGRIDADFGTGQLAADGMSVSSVSLDRPTSPGFLEGVVLLRRETALAYLAPAPDRRCQRRHRRSHDRHRPVSIRHRPRRSQTAFL